MPARQPVLSPADARRLVGDHGFAPCDANGARGECLGVELEWLAVCLEDSRRPAPFDLVRHSVERLDPLPGGSLLTFEPGGQVELSSPPLPRLDACLALARDARALGDALAAAGVGLIALGLEPGPRRRRALRTARYDAMEAYFDADGPAGRTMMRSTAALQVNLDLGTHVEQRWRAIHALAPVLAAAFANSPFGDDRPSGWRSTRLAVWAAIDAGRTAPVDVGKGYAPSARDAWVEYALAARVMLVRASDGRHVPMLAPLGFGEWVERGHDLGWPTADDVEYHLTTLFPPVRPRGWLEVRVIDALPAPMWHVAAAVSFVLVAAAETDPDVARAVEATRGLWTEAARDGLTHPALAAAASVCFTTALARLPDTGADAQTIAVTEEFVDRYVNRGRCPADDRLDAWRRTGRMLPVPDNAGRGAPA